MSTTNLGTPEAPPAGTRPAKPPDALEASAALASTRFGTFARHRRATGADVFPRGLPTRGARPVDQVPLAEALTRRWDDDRHIVLYTASRPYRVNNAALGKVEASVRLFAVDVDNHEDAPGWMEGERAKIASLLAAHPGGVVHTTRGGWRALYALPEAFAIRSIEDKERFALLYARHAAYLFERFGIIADDALTRWNQPVRLPHVVRGGRVFDAEIIAGDPRALGAFELPADVPELPDLRALARALPRWGGVAKRWEPRREVLRVASAAFDGIPLPPYAECIAAAEKWAREEAPRAVMGQGGRATARSVAATLHVGFALHREDVARILVGAYNRRRCAPPWGEDELGELRAIAGAVARTPVETWGFMLTRDRTGFEAAKVALRAAAAARHVVPLEEVGARIVSAIEAHRALVVRATYGAGKTHEVARYVATRTTERVIVVVPRHEIARAWVAALLAAGERDVAYHASVVQRRREDGRRECDNKMALRLYREGGDVARDVCPTCPRARTCPAYRARPNPKARVHVLPREMLSKLDVGPDDRVVFDDAAVDLLTWHRLSVRQLRRVARVDAGMLPGAQAALLPVFVEALLAGPREAEAAARRGLAAASIEVPEGAADVLRLVAAGLAEGLRTPRLLADAVADGSDVDDTLRDVGRVRQVLRFAAAYAAGGGAIQWSKDVRSVHGESAAATLLRTHRGRLVVLDAAANVEELWALCPELHVERLDVDDAGDDTRRVLLFATQATRTGVHDRGRREKLLALWLGAAFERLRARRVRRPVLVTYKGLEDELRAHPAVVAWEAEHPRWKVRFAHFGGLRGSNRFRSCDAVVTIGDPWLNGDDVLGRAEWLGLDEPSYRVAFATAELGQAHGRSRSVRRTRRLTHVHVGRLVPDGWGSGVAFEPLDGGPPGRTRRPAARVEFGALVAALGGNRAAAAALGCSASAIAGWRGGSRGLPQAELDRARGLVASTRAPKTASSEEVPGRGREAERMDAPPCKEFLRGCVHPEGGASSVRVDPSLPDAFGHLPEETERCASTRRTSPGEISDPSSPLASMVTLEGAGERRRSAEAPREALPPSRQVAREGVRTVLAVVSPPAARGAPERAPTASTDAELARLAEALAAARVRYGVG